MRVVAGVARGVPLASPRGAGTRPITDRVKETLFAILGEQVIDAVVLDLYAGSGAIGIEALSRGAAHATFVERRREAVAAIRANLERAKLAGAATVVAGDVVGFLSAAVERRYSIAFLDPPYEERAILAPLERLVAHLAPGATVVVKHFWRTEMSLPAGLASVRHRRFGETMLTFLSITAPGGDGRTARTEEEAEEDA
jgi:16S rRNA (guanine966-N2)-methyltransferase